MLRPVTKLLTTLNFMRHLHRWKLMPRIHLLISLKIWQSKIFSEIITFHDYGNWRQFNRSLSPSHLQLHHLWLHHEFFLTHWPYGLKNLQLEDLKKKCGSRGCYSFLSRRTHETGWFSGVSSDFRKKFLVRWWRSHPRPFTNTQFFPTLVSYVYSA